MISNPFIIHGYVSPEYFCNRDNELMRLVSSIENNRNVTLHSMRRTGKTSLLYHLNHYLAKNKTAHSIYLDLQFTSKLDNLVDLFVNAVYLHLFSTHKKLMNEFLSIFRTLKPSITYDPKTGIPVIELGIRSEHQARISAEDIFNFIKQYSVNNKVVIMLDEFQQITFYPEKNVEAFLRSKIQEMPRVNFIFSGSRKHLMTEMFFSPKRPFYQSTEMLRLDKLKTNEYSAFIKHNFEKGKKNITNENIEHILSTCYGHTYYVQFLCNRIYSTPVKKITKDFIDLVLSNILNENESTYIEYKNLLTDFQWRLTKAIAKEGIVENPTGSEFISKYELKAVSSVRTALKSLIDKEILYKDGNSYFVYDIFFSKWLKGAL